MPLVRTLPAGQGRKPGSHAVAAQGAAAVPYPSPKPHSARAGARREAGRQGRLGLGNRLGRARAQQPVYVRENLGAEDFRKQQHLPGRHTVGDRAWPGAALLPGLAGAGRRPRMQVSRPATGVGPCGNVTHVRVYYT